MDSTAWAMLLKPFIAYVMLCFFFGTAFLGLVAVQKWMPDGRLKRLLTRRVGRGR